MQIVEQIRNWTVVNIIIFSCTSFIFGERDTESRGFIYTVKVTSRFLRDCSSCSARQSCPEWEDRQLWVEGSDIDLAPLAHRSGGLA